MVKSLKRLNWPERAYMQAKIEVSHIALIGEPPLFTFDKHLLPGM